jgi:hypothetical protein
LGSELWLWSSLLTLNIDLGKPLSKPLKSP